MILATIHSTIWGCRSNCLLANTSQFSRTNCSGLFQKWLPPMADFGHDCHVTHSFTWGAISLKSIVAGAKCLPT